VNQRPKSPVREICTLGSVGAGGGQLPPATQWATSDDRPYRDREVPRSQPKKPQGFKNKFV